MKEESSIHLACKCFSWEAAGAGGKQSSAFYVHAIGFWFDLFFDPEVGGDIFLRNVSCLSTDCTTLHSIR
jgi:hypothetical protein